MGLIVESLVLRVEGGGWRVQDLGSRVWVSDFGLGFDFQVSGWGFGFQISGWGCAF